MTNLFDVCKRYKEQTFLYTNEEVVQAPRMPPERNC